MFSIETWNDVFGFKIKEADLRKPNENFLFQALLSYLKMFNFDVPMLMLRKNSENAEERMRFKIVFCYYIDHLYKISDKSNSFLCHDLIHPAPKKTAHMLNHLLNYYLFYSNLNDEIVSVADEKVRKRNTLLEKVNQMRFQNEEIKIEARTIESKIDERVAALPEITEQLERLATEERKKLGEKKTTEESLKAYQTRSDILRADEIKLRSEVVSDNEINLLLDNKEKYSNQIAEQEEFEKATLASNQERSQKKSKVQPAVKEIESIFEHYPISSLVSLKSMEPKFLKLSADLEQLSDKKSKFEQDLKKIEVEIQNIEDSHEKKEVFLQEIQVEFENQKLQQNGLLATELKNNDNLQTKLISLEEDLQGEEAHQEFLYKSAVQLVNYCKEVL